MVDTETPFETDQVESIDNLATSPQNQLFEFVRERFNRAKDKRVSDENRWTRAWTNFRGIYGDDVKFTETEKSRVFIKVTKTKVQAAYGQIIEVLFGNNDFPITVEPTKLPEGVSESVHFDPQSPPPAASPQEAQANANTPPQNPFGVRGEGLPPGATIHSLQKKLGPLGKKLEPLGDKVVEGPGVTPSAITFHPAMVAAKRMEKQIHDQLDESGASKQLRSTAFEMALFGTGILKGPFAIDKEYPNWTPQGEYEPIMKVVPSTSHVSIWNFYPDPDSANMDEAEWVVERHKMSRTQLRQLRVRPFFSKDAIEAAIDGGFNYQREMWENIVEDNASSTDIERWEVLEYWGYVDVDLLTEFGLKLPKKIRRLGQVNANIWVCNGEILRCVLNPFKPSRIPYYAVPYELNPYGFFGVGVAENMDDTQTLMNGFMRMAVDNAVLSGNLIIEVDENNLSPGQNLDIYPGKVFRRAGGAPGQAIFGTKFPNVSNENMMLFDKARVLADESTGFPSFAHGQTGVQGVGRTASGISMLMNAANGSIRTVVKNVDDYLLGPLGKAFFSFNMQFNFNPEIRGDLEVRARGTESLMANEVRSQRLMQFLGVVLNPMLAPFVKMDAIVRDIAISLDLDPDKVTNSMADAAIQAEILKGFRAEMPQMEGGGPMSPPAPGQGAGGSVPGANAFDTTGSGGGQIGTGSVSTPGEQGFSANTGGG